MSHRARSHHRLPINTYDRYKTAVVVAKPTATGTQHDGEIGITISVSSTLVVHFTIVRSRRVDIIIIIIVIYIFTSCLQYNIGSAMMLL